MHVWTLLAWFCCSNIGIVAAAKWDTLNVAVARPPNLPQLPDKILKGLSSAIRSLNTFINVRSFPMTSSYVATDTIVSCSKSEDFRGSEVFVDYFVDGHTTERHSIDDNGLKLKALKSNFVLFLSVNTKVCQKDPFMLAGAAPCMQPNDKLRASVPRPLCGRLIICLDNSPWKNFASYDDLFRHEIMHALGFGTIIPDKYGNEMQSVENEWKHMDGFGEKYDVHYLDFGIKATKAARTYFGCDSLPGIEADDATKIHLNEYIYGNELMTPVINNGNNYLTFISAFILEATHLGNVPWYRTNKTSVYAESRHFWYGRSWGCSFATKSCHDYIRESESNSKLSSFPFCNEDDYRQYLLTRKPGKVCFSADNTTFVLPKTCNLMKDLIQPGGQFKPRTLLTQFPRLRHVLDGVGSQVYGSDSFHRYCPMIKEVLDDTYRNFPMRTEVIPC
uniref:Leishmanolysin-like peptidase n=1 Tax=Panagrellus redivivus TaxID=6233 RepID=A0A7E4W2T2_PANRE